jgi:hypothetical protein
MRDSSGDTIPGADGPDPANMDPRTMDPWTDWQPDWRGTPHGLQERHSPTEDFSLRLSAGREQRSGRRRITDARLWAAMSPAQQDAAIEIAALFEALSRGIGYTSSDWTRLRGGGGGNPAEIQGRLFTGYADWARRCHKAGVSHSMILDILAFGFSCHALDRDRRARPGWSRRNLLKGLALYCEVKGWPS